MNGRKYLLRSMNVLNVLLVAVIAYFLAIPSAPQEIRCALPTPQKSAVPADGAPAPRRGPSSVDYAVISDQNLFHPERRIPPEKKEEKTAGRPDVNLFGTLITGDMSIAFLEDRKAPVTSAGRGKRQIALRKGGALNGYLLRDVEADRIVLVKGEEQVIVMLTDGEKRKAEMASSGSAAGQASTGAAGAPPPKALPAPTRPATAAAMAPGAGGGSYEARPTAAAAPSAAVLPSPSGQTPSPHGPGIGASGSWPPTKSTIEQTRQKIREGQKLRLEQLQ